MILFVLVLDCMPGGCLEHFCWKPTCCNGQDFNTCVYRFTHLFTRVFERLGSDLPSVVRWYTFLPHLMMQTLGKLTYRLLPRLASSCFIVTASTDDQDDFHAHVTKKKRLALESLESGASETMPMVLIS